MSAAVLLDMLVYGYGAGYRRRKWMKPFSDLYREPECRVLSPRCVMVGGKPVGLAAAYRAKIISVFVRMLEYGL